MRRRLVIIIIFICLLISILTFFVVKSISKDTNLNNSDSVDIDVLNDNNDANTINQQDNVVENTVVEEQTEQKSTFDNAISDIRINDVVYDDEFYDDSNNSDHKNGKFNPPEEDDLPNDVFNSDLSWCFSKNYRYVELDFSDENLFDLYKIDVIDKDGNSIVNDIAKKDNTNSYYFRLKNVNIDEIYLEIIDINNNTLNWLIKTVDPTCTNSGYTIVNGGEDQSSKIMHITNELGHDYRKWNTIYKSDGVNCGKEVSICKRCGEEGTRAIYPKTDFPIIKMYGDTSEIQRNVEVSLTGGFKGKTYDFESYIGLKYQGHSTVGNEKKNYTIKFYQDDNHTERVKLKFGEWPKDSKYILKANYVDSSQARNVVCANIWADVCRTRDGTKHIKNLFNYGAVDGFPVSLYLNDEFIGLYTLTLHKDDDLFDLDEGQEDAMVIINHSNLPESLFMAKCEFNDESDWELEYCGIEDKQWAKDKLNDFIDFVMNSSDEDFANNKTLKKYVNIDSAIDYLITMYSLGLNNSYAKNMVMVSYSDDPWILSMFDMEDAFGLTPTGTDVYPVDYMLPSEKDGIWTSNTGSLLWDRLLNNYYDRILQRYLQLRQDTLTTENILNRVNNYMNCIPEKYYNADRKLYPNMVVLDTKNQIEKYLTDRFMLLDEIFVEKESLYETN